MAPDTIREYTRSRALVLDPLFSWMKRAPGGNQFMPKFTFFLLSLFCFVPFGFTQNPAPGEQVPPSPATTDSAASKTVPSDKAVPVDEPTQPGVKPSKSAAAIDPNTYVIGAEDVLYVRVWKDADLSGMVDVRPDGMISMQLVGEIKAAGMTPEQLAKVLAERLSATHKHPEVNVQVVKVLSKKFFIQGEVRRPGSYPLAVPTRMLEALVNAGGFQDFAKTKKIYLLRGTQRFPFNYAEVSKGKHTEQNILVQNGDQIFVP